jgi:hypothetical protein
MTFVETSNSLKNLGYEWSALTPEEIGKTVGNFLEEVSAEGASISVYANNNSVYNTLIVKYKDSSGADQFITFRLTEGNKGKSLDISLDMPIRL